MPSILLPLGFAHAQSEISAPDKIYQIVLDDGSTLIGVITKEEELSILFRDISGSDIVIARNRIKKMTRRNGEIVNGNYRRFDPNTTRLLLAPNARTL